MSKPMKEGYVEIWKPVVGFEPYYEVSNLGRVQKLTYRTNGSCKKLKDPRLLKLRRTKEGYFHVSLTNCGNRRNSFVHRLMLMAFFGEPQPGQEAAHKDGIPGHNLLPNLVWATPVENHAHKFVHGTATIGERNGFSKLTDAKVKLIREKREGGATQKQLAQEYGVTVSTINLVCRRKRWAHVA